MLIFITHLHAAILLTAPLLAVPPPGLAVPPPGWQDSEAFYTHCIKEEKQFPWALAISSHPLGTNPMN